MNWDAIGAMAEVIGVVAIIASLIYVAIQIRQNTQITRANIINETNTDAQRIPEIIAQDAELAAIYHKGTHGQSLTGTDLVRFQALVEMYVLWFENADTQFAADLWYQEKELDDVVDYLSEEVLPFFSTPEVREWSDDTHKKIYPSGFVEKIDKHIRAAETGGWSP